MTEFELEYVVQIHGEEVSLLFSGWIGIQFAVITAAYFLRDQRKGFIQWFLFLIYLLWTFLTYGRLLLVFTKIDKFQGQLIDQGFSEDIRVVEYFVVGFGLIALLAIVATYVILFHHKFSEIR